MLKLLFNKVAAFRPPTPTHDNCTCNSSKIPVMSFWDFAHKFPAQNGIPKDFWIRHCIDRCLNPDTLEPEWNGSTSSPTYSPLICHNPVINRIFSKIDGASELQKRSKKILVRNSGTILSLIEKTEFRTA